MMKKLILLLAFGLYGHTIHAQRTIPAPGQVTSEEWQLRTCDFEPAANAVKLLDLQEVEIENDGYSTWLETRKRVRIKIFNEKGYPFATVQIPYYNIENSTQIADLTGYVMNTDENGKTTILTLDKKEFYKNTRHDDLNMIRFTFPALKPGSIIEFSYRKIEKNIIEIDPWYIQDEIPVYTASCTVQVPGYSSITQRITGTDTIAVKTENVFFGTAGKIKKSLLKERIPSFRPEPLMSAMNDNLLRVLFHVVARPDPSEPEKADPDYQWAAFGSRFLQILNTELDLKRDIPGTDEIINTARLIRLTEDRISYIYNTVKKQFPGKRGPALYPDDIRKAWSKREGNAAEINLVLLNLLRKSDIDAHPLLVSTRENGMIDPKFPSPGQLNGLYILVRDGETYYVMDAAQEHLSPFIPPPDVLNRKGLLLKKNDYKWIDITDNRILFKQTSIMNGLIDPEAVLQGNLRITHFDYAKQIVARNYAEKEQQSKAGHFINEDLIADSVNYEFTGNYQDPVIENAAFRMKLNNTGDFYFLNPKHFSSMMENPFTAAERQTSIDFGYKQEQSIQMNIEIPASFIPDHLPASLIIRAPDSSFLFRRSVKFTNGIITYYQKFEISQPQFEKEQYPAIKEFFDRVYALMAEEIVLKKK